MCVINFKKYIYKFRDEFLKTRKYNIYFVKAIILHKCIPSIGINGMIIEMNRLSEKANCARGITGSYVQSV